MTNPSDFFTALATRAWKENDLSDVTFAMCEGDSVFRQFFLDFFFPNAKLLGDEVSISRERPTPNGRPDFWIETQGGDKFIVEVKIWDGNHHFEQYHKDINDWTHLGYIANYSLEDFTVKDSGETKTAAKLGCKLATWKEFILRLERYSCLNDPFIDAYLRYLKAVCPYEDFEIPNGWKISTVDFVAIVKNLECFDRAIRQNTLKDIGVKPYTRSPRHFATKRKVGRFFEWEWKVQETSYAAWGWIGIRYIGVRALLCVEFEDRVGWGKAVCDKYRNAGHIHNGVLRFFSKKDINANEEAINDFLRNVITAAKGGTVPPGDRITTSADDACSMMPLLSMKCLPVALEQMFKEESAVKEISDQGYSIKLGYKNDQEVPLSHCGRYFELTPCGNDTHPSQESPTTYFAWIGVIYTKDCKRKANGKNYAKDPAFVVELPVSFPRPMQMPKGWLENTWGWFSYEIEDCQPYQKAFEEAKSALCDYLKLLKQQQTHNA